MNVLSAAWDRTVRAFAQSEPAVEMPSRKVLAGDAIDRGGTRTISISVPAFERAAMENPAARWNLIVSDRPASDGLNLSGYICGDLTLYDALDLSAEDPEVAAALRQIRNEFGTLPTSLASESREESVAKIIGEASKAIMHVEGEFGWNAFLVTAGMMAIRHGFAVHQIFWHYHRGRLVPHSYRHEHPARFAFAEDGRLLVWDGTKLAIPPYGKFVVTRIPAPYGNGFGESQVYCLRFLIAAKRLAMKGWVTFAERVGTPILIFKIPADLDDKSAKTEVETVLKNLGRSDAIILSMGEEVETVQRTSATGAKSPQEAVLDYFDAAIAKVLTGGTLMLSKGDGGAYALGKVQERTRDAGVAWYARILEESVTRGVVAPMIAWNWGETDEPIVFKIDTETKADAATLEITFRTARDSGLSIPEAWARKQLGIPMPEAGEPVLSPPKPEPPAPGGGGREGESKGGKTEDPSGEGDDEEEPAFAEFSESDRAANKAAADLALDIQGRLDRIGKALRAENADAILAAFGDALENVRKGAANIGLIEMDSIVALLAGLEIPNAVTGAAEALGGARALALMEAMRATERILPFPAAAVEDAPEAYKQSFEWMRSRKIASKSDIEDMARAIAKLEPTLTSYDLEQTLRRDVLAMKDSIGAEMTQRFRDRVASSVSKGETVAKFLADVDADVEAGKLPEGMDGYTELVYRQETANAYAEQRRAQYESGEMAPFVAGRRFSNALLPSSRETHKAIHGLFVRKGSEADRAAGHPPWAFRCTCTFSTVIVADPTTDGPTEPENALARVRSIERFK